ncbi:uncharacterized protein LOC141535425 [Cotesia typhae]|uniref:uncharacterized protein LOC141535425 n=1 Tax=Cotesia typhae TaxID=2053667 RepID=UPI003D6951CB
MYGYPAITQSMAQDMINDFKQLMTGVSAAILKNLKKEIPVEYHDFIEVCFESDIFDNFQSTWKSIQQLKASDNYIAPQQFKIGEIDDNKTVGNTVVFTKKSCYGQMIPLRATLKKFLELPNVFKVVRNFISNESATNDIGGVYTSLFQGTIWKNISQIFTGKTVVPLYLYYDDFEINNPLSSAAGIHKVGGLYCSIASLPPKFASATDNILLAQLIYNSDYKEFGAERCFAEIKTEFNHLAKKGITIEVDGENHTIYFVLIGLLGDNLALNSLLGFNECFISDYYCRFCRASKNEARKLTVENRCLLRTKQNYELDLLDHHYGVKTVVFLMK